MSPCFIKYPKIYQFKDIVRDFNKNRLDIPNPVTFTGTVKLHGTNASFQYDVATKLIYPGKRNSLILTEKEDNYNFSDYTQNHILKISNLLRQISEVYPLYTHIAIFGEFAGDNIQSGVGICNEPKRFYPFEIIGVYKNKEDTLDINRLLPYIPQEFKALQTFPTYEITIDFNNPSEVINQLTSITEQVENLCPVAAYYGHGGTGEGVVWSYTNPNTLKTTRFKVKGTKHSTTKVKTLVPVDIQIVESINAFVEYAVTENRVRQAMLETNSCTLQDISNVIKWIGQDVKLEEKNTLEKNNLKWKQVSKAVSNKCKEIYLNLIEVEDANFKI